MSATTDKPTPAPATDWKQPIRFAVLRILSILALVVTATTAGLILAEFGTVNIALGAVAVVVLIGLTFAGVLWGLTTHGIRATWGVQPKPPRPLPSQPVHRVLPITGNGQTVYEPLDPLEDDPATPMIEGWWYTKADFAAFLAEAWSRGWSLRAWTSDPFILPSGQQVTRKVWEEMRDFARQQGLLVDSGQSVAYKPGLSVGKVVRWLDGQRIEL